MWMSKGSFISKVWHFLFCSKGAPDIDYNDPFGGNLYESDFSTSNPMSSYNADSKKWNCPNAFALNNRTANFWTDRY